MQKVILLTLMLLILGSTELRAIDYRLVKTNAGYEHSQSLKEGDIRAAIGFFHQQHEWRLGVEGEAPKAFLQYRLRFDAAEEKSYQNLDQDNLEKFIAYLEHSWGSSKLAIGWQEITWGENLILPVLDVVNPRDITHVRGFYDPDAKQPSPLLNYGWIHEGWQVQLLMAPLPIKSRQPESVGDFAIDDDRRYRFGQDAEYGGSLGYLYESIDTRLYYYKHWPREPSYRFQAFSTDSDVRIDEQQVETFGLSSSYAAYDWLVRWDLARHQNFAVTSISPRLERIGLTQSIFGMTWTSETQQSLSVQWHGDVWDKAPEAFTDGPWVEDQQSLKLMNWIGGQANLSLMDSKYEPQIFALRGLNNDDLLLRLILLANLSDHVTLGGEYQKTNAETTSPKLLLSVVESLSLRFTYTW